MGYFFSHRLFSDESTRVSDESRTARDPSQTVFMQYIYQLFLANIQSVILVVNYTGCFNINSKIGYICEICF